MAPAVGAVAILAGFPLAAPTPHSLPCGARHTVRLLGRNPARRMPRWGNAGVCRAIGTRVGVAIVADVSASWHQPSLITRLGKPDGRRLPARTGGAGC